MRKISPGILIAVSLCALFIQACSRQSGQEDARRLFARSQEYYQKAVAEYKKLSGNHNDSGQLGLELGKIYYSHGEFSSAIAALRKSNAPQSKKMLAISLYRNGDFSDALEVFIKNDSLDEEYLYYYGLTCEKLNLFDPALTEYKKIKPGRFFNEAAQRIELIEKKENQQNIEKADAYIAQVISSAPAAQDYPQAGALVLLSDEKVEVTAQDTQVASMHYVVKILNERGKQEFSETNIDYDSTDEKVELEFARTIKPDGTIAEVGTRHLRDVSKYMNFPLYSNARVFIISFPEISEGASIEYKVKITSNRLINKKEVVLNFPLQSSEPVIAADFSFTFPKGRAMHLKNINEKYKDFQAELTPVKEEHGGSIIYRWSFKSIPQLIPEANMPPAVEVNPTILISTFERWQDIYDWWWKLAKDKILADSAIKEKVKGLISGKVSAADKARAVYDFCASKIRYVAVEYGQAGYEPHKAEDIFKNKYGDCKDQAILLVAMLREAGLESYPVLIPTSEYYNLNPDFPAVLFDHCIAVLILEGKPLFLDPTAETCAFGDLPAGDQARKVLICKTEGFNIEETPLFAPEHNLIRQNLSIIVNADEAISGHKSVESFGTYDQAQRYWFLYTQPELIQDTLNEKIQETSIGSKLNDYKIKNADNLDQPVELEYSFFGPEYFTSAGPLRIMPQLSSLDASLIARQEHKYPLHFDILDSRESFFQLQLPSGLRLKYLPESVSEDSPWMNFSAQYSRDKGRVNFHQKIILKKNIISESEYPEFKKFFSSLVKKIKQRIVLERVE